MRNLQLAMTIVSLMVVVTMAEVPEPWTSVRVQVVGNEVRISVWGRTYRFQNSSLPSSITTLGNELLATPIRLVGQTDAGNLIWTQSGVEVWEQDGEQV
ncbi:MAG: hypothetical protein ACK40X_10160, partial [Armatimonadota bacterium]